MAFREESLPPGHIHSPQFGKALEMTPSGGHGAITQSVAIDNCSSREISGGSDGEAPSSAAHPAV